MGVIEELKRDFVDPIKTFTEEVSEDTLGDARRFYSAQVRDLRRKISLAERRTREKTAAIRYEQEARKRRRRAILNRALILVAVLAAILVIIISLVLNHGG